MSTLKANRYENTSTSDGGINIDSSGRVLVGVSSSYANSNADDLQIGSNSSSTETGITLGSTLGSGIRFADSGSTSAGIIEYSHGTDYMRFVTNASEVMRLDSSGNLGIGNTNPSDYASGTENLVVGDTSSSNGITILTGTGNAGGINFADGTGGTDRGRLDYDHGDDRMRFYTASSEQMRITSAGIVCVNRTSVVHGGQLSLDYTNGTTAGLAIKDTQTSGTGAVLQVVNGSGTIVGSITQNQSTTSFNTSSDYRLKENVIDVTDGIARVKQLQPKRFNFIADDSRTVDGFLAHEAQAVVPEAVTGTHNAVEVWKEGEELPDSVSVGDNKLDEDGNTIPEYQGIDQSKLVPLLTAALQEAISKIETLEAKVAALEAA